ncbi:threonine--tRNA ligase [Candidatus Babeliales bacterium]|nr:threonine--tRNA ligase [Candidatus Babeliales bacterium]
MKKDGRLYALRHSAAHVLAQAVLELYPKTKLTLGPVTENGFFYDFLPEENLKEDDLSKIEAKMREILKKDYKIEGREVSKEEALKIYKDNPFKLEIIKGIEKGPITIFSQGDFFDLCEGNHVESTKEVQHFKLMGISGSYWRGDRDGMALQRISGVAFETAKDLEKYLKRIEEAKLYDHRKLGKELDLFSFHDEAPGSVFFHDKGLKIFNKLIEYSRKMHKDDYIEIKTPIILHEKLWKTSGHYDNYKENMFFTTIDDANYCIRPMNCPASMLLYNERPHSYRELPLRVAEYGLDHRYELSGVLHGLFRVRSFTMDDAHIFCTLDQVEDEVLKVLELANAMYKKFGFEKIKMILATKPEKAMGSDEVWDKATDALKGALERHGIDFAVSEGDGAFYGPKIELRFEDAMGRDWQCGTIQLDFFQPENFNLEYITSDQSKKRPVIIHRAVYGSLERFIGILLEHYRGHLPFWIAPEQVRVLTITDAQKDYASKVLKELRAHNIEAYLDESGDQIGGQIRKAQVDKIPWMLVIGKKEVENNTVTLRHSDGKQEFGLKLEDIISKACELSEF